MKGRDKEYKCIYCGKFISYKDIPDEVRVEFVPDTYRSAESTFMWHKKCKSKEFACGINP